MKQSKFSYKDIFDFTAKVNKDIIDNLANNYITKRDIAARIMAEQINCSPTSCYNSVHLVPVYKLKLLAQYYISASHSIFLQKVTEAVKALLTTLGGEYYEEYNWILQHCLMPLTMDRIVLSDELYEKYFGDIGEPRNKLAEVITELKAFKRSLLP